MDVSCDTDYGDFRAIKKTMTLIAEGIVRFPFFKSYPRIPLDRKRVLLVTGRTGLLYSQFTRTSSSSLGDISIVSAIMIIIIIFANFHLVYSAFLISQLSSPDPACSPS